jgi:DNA-binding beta-propeller fold protein YncE
VVAAIAVAVGLIVTSSPPAPSQRRLAVHTLLRATSVSAVARGAGGSWATDDISDRLIRFDRATGSEQGSVQLPGRPVALLVDGGKLWVASAVSSTVEEVSPRPLRVVRTVPVPQGPAGLAALDGRIWVASVIAGQVSPLDPRTGVVGAAVTLPDGAVRIASGFGALWVTGTSDGLTELQPRNAGAPALHSLTVGQGPIGVATGAGSVWVADAQGGAVSRVDPLSRRVIDTVHTGGNPVAVAVAGGRVWVADGTGQRLRTVFPAPGLAPLNTESTPRVLLSVGDGVWVATANPGRVLSAQVTGGS